VDVALLYSRLQVSQYNIMNCIILEFNDIISLYKKNESERRRFVTCQSAGYFILLLPIFVFFFYRSKTKHWRQRPLVVVMITIIFLMYILNYNN